jgi:hypothetical protein
MHARVSRALGTQVYNARLPQTRGARRAGETHHVQFSRRRPTNTRAAPGRPNTTSSRRPARSRSRRPQLINQHDLALAYSPGGGTCEEIVKDPAAAFRYTSRGNPVAVITNGTAGWAWATSGRWRPSR